MDIRTFRASTMHEALALVRKELGPDAAILQTREVRKSRLFGLLPGAPQVEITASTSVNVPSRLPPREHPSETAAVRTASPAYANQGGAVPAVERPVAAGVGSAAFDGGLDLTRANMTRSARGDDDVRGQLAQMQQMLQELYRKTGATSQHDWPEAIFRLFTDLIEADVPEDQAREMIETVRGQAGSKELSDPLLLKTRLARMVESAIAVCGAIQVIPGQRRVAALIGPTGVGKTTTIAKLAANYRLRENRSVGLITVDTYRIAAVEQLRTYAEIIDLPMEVVSSPREMREAIRKLANVDLVLMDTAGRSPRDSIKIRELRAFLNEAQADEVHLVLSSVSGTKALRQTIEQFQAAQPTAMILTKLDEAPALGSLLEVLRDNQLPLSYLTNGQSVPDDIEVAQAGRVARMVLGIETV
ncbi:MAG: flagellar biosynthesis protein FlhF [Planctomycetota bacterium]|nr:MAG: flagellar biosynthesis protein FlhF [Planctomycetota bacterium]